MLFLGGFDCDCNLGDAGDTSDVVSALPRPATGTPESKVIWYGCVRAYICARCMFTRKHFGPVVIARLEPLFLGVLECMIQMLLVF